MPKAFFKVQFALMFLISTFLIGYSAETKSKLKLSEKYKPPGNPGGVNFYEDEDFAESYKLYKKRREILKKKKLQSMINTNTSKENLAKKLEKKKVNLLNLNREVSNLETCICDDGKDAMVNQYGINIARLKGAIFIDQEEVYRHVSEQQENKHQEKEKVKEVQEKTSSINVTKKNIPVKKTCLHKSITHPYNGIQHKPSSLNSSEDICDMSE
ncbi:hypothetical protein GOY13_01735 [Wolbachia endosymbiont of Cruorifilaria tuberocauda]|uniref:TRP75-related protein n=1 Tax=Wolbachia endosymbiont of Cruorifilaria tuberocauda TaxID=1812111 RepID=UPI00158F323B|nr:TRP75-related protein [Wolbachia endosymbiont of Cruorifilaria tuberocauda]QKX01658.1 hypothetical protein GOY13_01735 [Wolbachia endosymbiont of Cruorifilaria tuberocauda]